MGVMPTLGSAAGWAGGLAVGGVGKRGGAGGDRGSGLAAVEKMSASCLMASSWASPMEARGEAGEGLRMAQHRSMAARMAASAEESCGILP